jgi:hypothetical protein
MEFPGPSAIPNQNRLADVTRCEQRAIFGDDGCMRPCRNWTAPRKTIPKFAVSQPATSNDDVNLVNNFGTRLREVRTKSEARKLFTLIHSYLPVRSAAVQEGPKFASLEPAFAINRCIS